MIRASESRTRVPSTMRRRRALRLREGNGRGAGRRTLRPSTPILRCPWHERPVSHDARGRSWRKLFSSARRCGGGGRGAAVDGLELLEAAAGPDRDAGHGFRPVTGICVSCGAAVEPVQESAAGEHDPRSMMSAASSGGVLSSVERIASMTASPVLQRGDLLGEDHGLGQSGELSRPRTSACTLSSGRRSRPSLISSAVCWPIRSLYPSDVAIPSPPTRRLCETTIPPGDHGDRCRRQCPRSCSRSARRPGGRRRCGHRPSIRYAWRAPAERRLLDCALLDAGHARGRQTTTRGCAKRCWCTFWMKWRSICSVTSKSAMTPSLSADRRDRARRAAEHLLCLDANGVHLA